MLVIVLLTIAIVEVAVYERMGEANSISKVDTPDEYRSQYTELTEKYDVANEIEITYYASVEDGHISIYRYPGADEEVNIYINGTVLLGSEIYNDEEIFESGWVKIDDLFECKIHGKKWKK